MRTQRLLGTSALFGLLAFAAAFAGGACGGSGPSDQGHGGMTTTSSGSTSMTGTDSGTGDDCYPNPTTYLEIINACTNAQAVDVAPVLPLLQPDGGLPPLP